MRTKFCALLTALPFLLLIADLTADSYRCGQKLIRSGDSTADLLRLCGEPHHKDRGYENIKVEGVHRNVRVERWYYKKGRRSLGRIMLVYRGRIAGISVGGR